jgi:membrane protein YdbS with pleckstrin-like domain
MSEEEINSSKSASEFYDRLQSDKSEVAKDVINMLDELSFSFKPGFRPFLGSFLIRFVTIPLVVIFPLFAVTSVAIGMVLGGDPFAQSGFISFVLTSVVTVISQVIYYLSIINTEYHFENGVLYVQEGGLYKEQTSYEIFRVQEVSAIQGLANRSIDIASLQLTISRPRSDEEKVTIYGFGSLKETENYASRLRELVLTMRTIPWLKGFIT